jgi:transposase
MRPIVAESFAPGAVVPNVARRADISAGQIYPWRQELRATAETGFTPVLIAPAACGAAFTPRSFLLSRTLPSFERKPLI